MDIVYPLGKGSLWANMELKYSLRSIEKYLLGFDNIYIIGEKPLFINEKIKHVFFQDKHSNAARNIMEKVIRACELPELSQDFLFMNDDYFFKQPCLIEEYSSSMPYKGTLEEAIERNPANEFQKHLISTVKALRERNLSTLNYDGHTPMVMNKERLPEIVKNYSWNIPYGYTLRSIYGNEIDSPNKIKKADPKINHPYTCAQWEALAPSLPECFSIGDASITHGFKKYLEARFPQKSSFEK